MRDRPPPADSDAPGDRRIVQGYLLEEELRPDEIRRIESRLSTTAPRRARSGQRGWLLAAAAAVLLFSFFAVRQRPDAERDTPVQEVPPQATSSREMVLEIVRTDLPDAKPYTLRIKLETPTNLQ